MDPLQRIMRTIMDDQSRNVIMSSPAAVVGRRIVSRGAMKWSRESLSIQVAEEGLDALDTRKRVLVRSFETCAQILGPGLFLGSAVSPLCRCRTSSRYE